MYTQRCNRNWINRRHFMMIKCMATLSKKMISCGYTPQWLQGVWDENYFGLGVDPIVLSKSCQMLFIVSRTPALQDAEW